MKKALFMIAATLFIQSSWAAPKPIDQIVATVNDEAITQSDLNTQVRLIKRELAASGLSISASAVLQKKALDQLIDTKLLLQAAKNNGIDVSSKEIDRAIAHVAEMNHMTTERLYQSAQQDGLPRDLYRQQVEQQLKIQKLQQLEIASHVSISESEIDAYKNLSKGPMPAYHVGDILVALPSAPTPAEIRKAQKTAEQIMEKLKTGSDFQQVAVTESNGSKSFQGGDLGWRKLPELPEAFASEIQGMVVGDIAGPIRAPNGFHIIKLLGIQQNDQPKWVEQSEIRMIFIPAVNKAEVEQGATIMNTITSMLKRGSSFDSLARQYSKDKVSASQGGYTGWVAADQFSPALTDAIRSLPPGKTSQPVLTEKGWYLIKMLAKKQVPKTSKTERAKIQQLIFERKIEERMETLLNNLRNEAYIKRYL